MRPAAEEQEQLEREARGALLSAIATLALKAEEKAREDRVEDAASLAASARDLTTAAEELASENLARSGAK